jgi:hypothetical protein
MNSGGVNASSRNARTSPKRSCANFNITPSSGAVARTLEALSIALGWHPQHLVAVLRGRTPPEVGEPISDNGRTVSSRLDAIDERLGEIADLLHEMNANLTTVISHAHTDR